jgi:IS5 family transposase
MQGREDGQRGYLDVEALAGELLVPGGVFAFLAEHRGRLFPDSMMEDLFPSGRGRPSVPAPVIGAVLVLQALQGLSDRETAEALTFDLRWKAACGYGLNETAFHPTTLTYWRKRLAASPDPHRIMAAVADVIASTGVLKGKRRRAVDSTVLDDAVARQDTITQLIAGIRRFGREVPGGKELLAAHATGYDYTRTGKPDIAWDDQDAKEGLVSALVTDALALLAAVDSETLEGKAADAYALLALVAGQDVEPAEGSDGTDGRWRIARKVAPDRLISTVDPDTRDAHKTPRPSNADSPSMTSPSMRLPALRPARTASLRPSPPNAVSRSAPPAPAVPSGIGAPPQRGDASSISTNTTRYCANTAAEPRTRLCKMTTGPTGPWSSGPSPGSPAATDAFRTGASTGTTPGCNCGSRD